MKKNPPPSPLQLLPLALNLQVRESGQRQEKLRIFRETHVSFFHPRCPFFTTQGKAADGGSWGTLKYVGSTTQAIACGACLCCGPLACCILLCPQDEKDAYAVDGKVYDAEGNYLQQKNNEFVPKRQTMQR